MEQAPVELSRPGSKRRAALDVEWEARDEALRIGFGLLKRVHASKEITAHSYQLHQMLMQSCRAANDLNGANAVRAVAAAGNATHKQLLHHDRNYAPRRVLTALMYVGRALVARLPDAAAVYHAAHGVRVGDC